LAKRKRGGGRGETMAGTKGRGGGRLKRGRWGGQEYLRTTTLGELLLRMVRVPGGREKGGLFGTVRAARRSLI